MSTEKVRQGGLGHGVLRSTEEQKQVGVSIFAGKPFTIMLHGSLEDEEIVPTKKSKLHTHSRLSLQQPRSVSDRQVEID